MMSSLHNSGKFGGTSTGEQDGQTQGLQYAEDAAEHENMKAVLKGSPQGGDSGPSVVPGLRTRTRASRGRLGLWASGNDESPNATDDAADEIMERIVKSATQGPSQRTQPRERKRSRANRKSLARRCRCERHTGPAPQGAFLTPSSSSSSSSLHPLLSISATPPHHPPGPPTPARLHPASSPFPVTCC
ncbi:hypothetical protein JZ751_022170 [Albula glossodonta]|uniref:DAD domain-containing protein n=1 Tax=Albula glossodonta TaxID=121402 RepID=A0A8T2MQT3_9TELE|nr:hypothetical protein JZ751_022170 [Albula glossodonta]